MPKPSPKTGHALIAVDTNVLVRFLLQDDPDQSARARYLFETETIFLSCTVLLETFWVLRTQLKHPDPAIARLISAVTRQPNVEVEDAQRLHKTFVLTGAGMGFADALHLTAADPQMRFATFDRALIRAATRSGMTSVVSP